MIYDCCDPRRRQAVESHPTLNGIDFLEVRDGPGTPLAVRQRELFVHFLKPLLPQGDPQALKQEQVFVEGGDRFPNIQVTKLEIGPDLRQITVTVDQPGDFSNYRLRLRTGPDDPLPPAGFDRLLSSIEFSFKVACDTNFDCREDESCLPDPAGEPLIDYLAKDYQSFRTLMLDRLSLLAPDWRERSPADLGVVLVELMAYVGDQLSYRQDAVATEFSLGTARRRVSVRRHALLVDYIMHEGCNARTWVQVRVDAPRLELPKGTQLLTVVPGLPERIEPFSKEYDQAIGALSTVFETMHTALLHADLQEMYFYTWGDERCCLPKGATHATLRNPGGRLKALSPGMALAFVEQLGPDSRSRADADPAHRQVVRLTRVRFTEDPLFKEEGSTRNVQVIDIAWEEEDALRFPLCLFSKQVDGAWQPISVALGNLVLADHGRTIPEPEIGSHSIQREPLGVVPSATLFLPPASGRNFCEPSLPREIRPRFRPHLKEKGLTHAIPYEEQLFRIDSSPVLVNALDSGTVPGAILEAFRSAKVRLRTATVIVLEPGLAWAAEGSRKMYRIEKRQASLLALDPPSAAGCLVSDPQTAKPAIHLISDGVVPWTARSDLLRSGPESEDYVVEMELDGTAYLRFGQRPRPGMVFEAGYRIGNGLEGNIGAETLHHVVTRDGSVLGVYNPLPAVRGQEPETIEEVRLKAPVAFRTQERAVTPDDYARKAELHPLVQHAVARFAWTGSWRTVFITIDPRSGNQLADFEEDLLRHLEPYRMAGHDIEIEDPHYVPLDIQMKVCLKPGYFRADVRRALQDIFSSRVLPGRRLGFFHPDNFTFGQPVYLSKVYAVAQSVDGVDTVQVTRFSRFGIDDELSLKDGQIVLAPREIAQLENNRDFPDRGVLTIEVEGGR